jgi:WD40 repeat protein
MTDHTAGIFAFAILPDGEHVVAGANDQTVKVWHIPTGVARMTLQGHTGVVWSVALLSGGQRVLSGAEDRTLMVWDLEQGVALMTIRTRSTRVLAVTPDGHYAVAVGDDGDDLQVWDLEQAQESPPLQADLAMEAVTITPDGRRVCFLTKQHTVEVWDLEQRQPLRALGRVNERVDALAVTLDSQYLLTGSFASRTLKMWDIERGTILQRRDGWAAVALLSSQHAISQRGDCTLTIWDLVSGVKLRTLPPLPFPLVKTIAVTPDGRFVIVLPEIGMPGDYGRKLYVLALATPGPWRVLAGHTDEVYALAPVGVNAVLSASGDGTLKIWDLQRGEVLRTLTGHTAGITAVAVTADARRAYSVAGFNRRGVLAANPAQAEHDHTLRVWDLDHGTVLATFVGDGPLTHCAVAPDGVTVIAIGPPHQIHFLRLEGAPEPSAFWYAAVLLSNRALASLAQGDAAQAIEYYQRSLQIARELHDRSLEGVLWDALGNVHVFRHAYHEALGCYHQGLEVARASADRRVLEGLLYNVGRTHVHLGEYKAAVHHYRVLLASMQENRDALDELDLLAQLGYALLRSGAHREACKHLQCLLEAARHLSSPPLEGLAHFYLSKAYQVSGKHALALTHGEAAIAVYDLLDDHLWKAQATWHLALLLRQRGALGPAIALMERCMALERAIGHPEVENHAAQLQQVVRALCP